MSNFYLKLIRLYFPFSIFLLFSSTLAGQSLSGVWEGTYTHFYTTCCDEQTYKLKLIVYEDARGALWIETETRPVGDNHAIGQLFAVGSRQADGKIAIKELNVTFSSLPYVNSCFKQCRWCVKELLLNYNKQGKVEMLTGLWNSKECYPGGEVSLSKIAELPNGDDIRLLKLGQEVDKFFDAYRYTQKPFRFYSSEEPNEVKLSLFGMSGLFGYTHLKVDNVEDFDDESNFTLQNVTMRIEDRYQTIVYLELKDKRTGKIYPINPKNISKKEILDLPYSPWGLTFPNKSQWDKIMAARNVATTDNSTTNQTPIKQINERPIEVSKDAIKVKESAKTHIELWDNNIEDGDIISLYVNEKCVLSKHRLTKDKKPVYELPLLKGKNIITMYAENLGDLPPNTASISININGKVVKTLNLKSDMNSSEAIELFVE